MNVDVSLFVLHLAVQTLSHPTSTRVLPTLERFGELFTCFLVA